MAAGAAIYEEQCVTCHTIDGASGIGPTWQGLFGRDVNLDDGSTAVADEACITESIREPNAKVYAGFQLIMLAFPDLSDEEIESVILFIQSLE